jgi:hypothetical protein
MQKVTNLCHFLPSCRDAKWLCRCKQHDAFAANTYQFFVRFPSQGVLCNICLCLRSKCSKGPLHRIGHNAKLSMLRPLPLWMAGTHMQSTGRAIYSAWFLPCEYGSGNWLVSSKHFYATQEYELCLLTNMDY